MSSFGNAFKNRRNRAGALWLGTLLVVIPFAFSIYTHFASNKLTITDSNTGSVFYLQDGKSQKIVINLNTAGVNDLQLIKGIGPAKAKSVIEYRKTIGCFKNKEQLKDVKGIGIKIYQNIEALLIATNCEE